MTATKHEHEGSELASVFYWKRKIEDCVACSALIDSGEESSVAPTDFLKLTFPRALEHWTTVSRW